MNRKLFVSAAASAALVIVMGANAIAADNSTATAGNKTAAGVTFVEHGRKDGLKNVVIEAGADPSVLELHFDGAQRVSFESVGTLLIVKADGTIWRYKPTVYQVIDGKQKNRLTTFRIMAKDRVSMKVDRLDSSVPLVVGPVSARNGKS